MTAERLSPAPATLTELHAYLVEQEGALTAAVSAGDEQGASLIITAAVAGVARYFVRRLQDMGISDATLTVSGQFGDDREEP